MRWRTQLLLGALLVAGCGGGAREDPAPRATARSSGDDATRVTVSDDESSTTRGGSAAARRGVASSAAPSALAAAPGVDSASAGPADPVWLNGEQLAAPDLRELEAVLGRAPAPGRYWYDPRSGLWGLEQHGAGGVTRAALRVPAPVPANASLSGTAPALRGGAPIGGTGAFVNDRELTARELTVLAQLLGWPPPAPGELRGRYVLDDQGRCYSIQGSYLGSLAAAASHALAASTSPAPCAWLHLGGKPDVLGRDVTVNCD